MYQHVRREWNGCGWNIHQRATLVNANSTAGLVTTLCSIKEVVFGIIPRVEVNRIMTFQSTLKF